MEHNGQHLPCTGNGPTTERPLLVVFGMLTFFDSWTFFSWVLHGYGFPPLFITWIMECVSTSSFSMALNGSLHVFFLGKRGLRQGDPMSLALFLLSMEYFSQLVKRRTSDSEFNFHLKCEKLKITHLLFADDLMLFS
ncbi:UNVERIFIED_CONTAM: hypothetical protein Slati_1722500 [Sesamum latifolium]|uniref:Reverse transcriptase domain-containing protein n=1 Tax=Sesamum latifolium TaxID=2727402 RepID=A0AAW2X1C4_9LAMI